MGDGIWMLFTYLDFSIRWKIPLKIVQKNKEKEY